MSTDDLTPRETPISKTLGLGLEACPCCNRTGKMSTGVQCHYCEGGRVVSREKAQRWRDAHPQAYPLDVDPDSEEP